MASRKPRWKTANLLVDGRNVLDMIVDGGRDQSNSIFAMDIGMRSRICGHYDIRAKHLL
jgi:hypothetical protein